jgi:hypothetical protein
MIHPGWYQQYPKPTDDAFTRVRFCAIREGWVNADLFIVVCQNDHTGLWHYSTWGQGPDMKSPCQSREWAMLLAQDHCVPQIVHEIPLPEGAGQLTRALWTATLMKELGGST